MAILSREHVPAKQPSSYYQNTQQIRLTKRNVAGLRKLAHTLSISQGKRVTISEALEILLEKMGILP